MPFFNEAQLEASIIQLFLEQRYDYRPGETIVRKDKTEVLQKDDLRTYLKERYAGEAITEMEVENAIRRIEQTSGGTLYDENRDFMKLLMNGFSMKREDPAKPNLYIYLVDFNRKHKNPVNGNHDKDYNRYSIVNQLEVQGVEQLRIPDAIVYINGLPLVVLEFKNAIKENTTIEDAYKQLTVRYRRDIPSLFRYNAFVVISDGVNNKFGSLFADYDFFTSWRKVEPKDRPINGIPSLKTMVAGLFDKGRLLDVLHNFIYFPDTTKNEMKVVCRYPQYYAARALYDNVLLHSRLNADGDGKGGTYFGATGCGKSFTMLFLSRLLMRSKVLCSPTILLITDRTDLDDQLSRQVLNAKQFIGDEMIMQVESREHLKTLLQGRTSGGVFLTTIQKFSKDIDLLSKRANIICISDEAHRSQVGVDEKVQITEEGVKRSYGFAKYLHDSLPNATYVGFTGTPIDATLQVFGGIVDEYTMIDAVTDGITKKIVYEGRASHVIIDSEKVKEIEDYYNRCAEEGSNEYQIEASKKAMTQMEQVLANPDLIRRLAADFVLHYERRVEEGATVEGKAMIVCATREIGYAIYKEIVKLRPEWTEVRPCAEGEQLTEQEKEKIRPIEKIKMVFIRQKDDPEELYNLLGPDDERKKLDLQFKEPKSNLKIAIVVDMWITGFDVPCLDTMYCYKPLQMHNLVQTVSRVNRNYPGKEKGLIVDYLGIKKNMNAAMRRYANGGQTETPTEVVEQSLKLFRDELDVLRRMIYPFEYTKFWTGSPLEQLDTLNQGAELMQQTDEKEHRFMKHVGIMVSAYKMCHNDDSIKQTEVNEVHFFSGVKSIIFKLTKGEAPDATKMNKRVLKMVNDSLISEEVELLHNMVMDNAEEIDLLANSYMARINRLPLKNTKVKLLEKLLRRVIDSVMKVNKVKAVDFTQRLNEIVKRYNDRTDDLVFADEIITEVAAQLTELLNKIKDESQLPDGIPDIEVKAFYDILKAVAEKYGFAGDFTEEQFKRMALEIKGIVDDKCQFIDWDKREDIKASMKVAIILTLAKEKYPPYTKDEVFKEIFEQAENFKKNRIHSEVKYNMNVSDGISMAAEPDVEK